MSTEPVSVCHQVSTTSHLELPTLSKYHSQTSGLIGSPTVPNTFNESLDELSRYLSPAAIKARIAVAQYKKYLQSVYRRLPKIVKNLDNLEHPQT